MILSTLQVDAGEFARRTGWSMKPQGACKRDRCVPFPRSGWRAGSLSREFHRAGEHTGGDAGAGSSSELLDVRRLAEWLGMPLVHDEAHGVWCLGPEAGGRALADVQAPELVLPDLSGQAYRLSSLRGTKVLLVAWASW